MNVVNQIKSSIDFYKNCFVLLFDFTRYTYYHFLQIYYYELTIILYIYIFMYSNNNSIVPFSIIEL